ncbi:hypothetical protein BC628DRAFT_444999 [Trametes gibbosa]|nr:hypothetical protein BC628DRAFT_444999 [Trametes gibbosa]
MSDDEYFADELDSAFLHELDAIENAQTHPSVPPAPAKAAKARQPTTTGSYSPFKLKPAEAPFDTGAQRVMKHALPSHTSRISAPSIPLPPPRMPQAASNVIEIDDSSEYDDAFDDIVVDDAALAKIDQACEREYDSIRRGTGQQPARPVAGSSRANGLVRRISRGGQLNLFGEIASEVELAKAPAHSAKQPFQRTRSKQMPLAGQAKKTKQWDRTAYAKTGWRKPKVSADKDKGRGSGDEFEEEIVEFEQFPAPEVPVGGHFVRPTPTMKLSADRLAAKTWIYPLNKPKRDYQYNIVKKCLFENTLVALPTGLGKTFIAGVVMLNYYNWFPEGKVIFVAPTKPLVAQQIDACHKTCGIPGSVAAELTGNVTKDRRINAWRNKRIFYATPQTLLNDLINHYVDALDIVLIVIDEAHRGTGDYAYAQVVRYMMQHNPHFRIMALTATPGGKPEAVQEIVDALHISHIEIRSETDPDLKKYLHTKHEKEHHVHMTGDIIAIRDALAALITPILKRVQNAGFLKNGNVAPSMLHPFRCQSTVFEMSKAKAPQYAIGAAAQLGPLARAMGYLMEQSTLMCYGYLKGISDALDETSSKKAIRKMDGFSSLMKELEKQASRGFSMHPKMDALRTILIDHFGQELPDADDGGDSVRQTSRAMVFVSFRECVEEIVELLNKESPIIRAKAFIGQSTDKQGKKGYAQKEQLEVIEQFKAGKYNVLVSTSIGEEGLDIGEVDVIVCYDAQKTPIRMLQRIGRTGRKQSGSVHILLAQGREEHNWQKAQSNYQEVQHFIVRASDLEVYGDVSRLIPDDIDPQPVEMEMEIEEYVREERVSRKGSLAKGDSVGDKSKKRKRDDDPLRNVPAAAAKGFVSVKELLVKNGGGKRAKKLQQVDLAHADEDDSDDEEIETGSVFVGPRRAASTSAVTGKGKGKGKQTLTRSKTTVGSNKKAAATARKKASNPSAKATSTQLERVSEDDSDDLAIERGVKLTKYASAIRNPNSAVAGGPRGRSSSPEIPLDRSIIDITTPDVAANRTNAVMSCSSPDRPLSAKRPSILDLSRSSSPELPLHPTSRSTSVSKKLSQSGESVAHPPGRSKSPSSYGDSSQASILRADQQNTAGDESMAWLIEDDEEEDLPIMRSSPARDRRKAEILALSDDKPLFLPSSSPRKRSPSSDWPEFLDDMPAILSPLDGVPNTHGMKMGPPALPAHVLSDTLDSPSRSDDMPPEPTLAIRRPGGNARKRIVSEALDVESSPLSMPPPSQRRLRRERPRSRSPAPAAQPPKKKKKRTFADVMEAQRHNPWIDLEATHSGDELSVGSSELGEHAPDSDDRMFLGEPGQTQVSPSYDQAAIYRQSLMTQAPGGGGAGPVFAHGPVRRGRAAFGPSRAGPSRYRRAVTSSPVGNEEEPDEYEFGSFVVEDDKDISLSGAPSSDY